MVSPSYHSLFESVEALLFLQTACFSSPRSLALGRHAVWSERRGAGGARAQKHGVAYGGLTRDEARLQGAEQATGIRGSAAMSAHSRAIAITGTMTPSAFRIRDKDGEAYCYLCKKVATAGHRSSQQHVASSGASWRDRPGPCAGSSLLLQPDKHVHVLGRVPPRHARQVSKVVSRRSRRFSTIANSSPTSS